MYCAMHGQYYSLVDSCPKCEERKNDRFSFGLQPRIEQTYCGPGCTGRCYGSGHCRPMLRDIAPWRYDNI